MTKEEQLTCIEHNVDAFTRWWLARASKVPAQWEEAEIRQWVMDVATSAWVMQMDKTRMHRYQMAKPVHGL